MLAYGQIFLDFHLPTPTTWFYFSALLAVSLFVKFTRLLSMRNLDVLTLFLFTPGLLLLLESHGAWFGYLWLLAATGYFLLRCLGDLALTQRPALSANLDLPGLVWLAGALFVSLVAVAYRHQTNESDPPPDRGTVPVAQAQSLVDKVALHVNSLHSSGEAERSEVQFYVARSLSVACHLSVVVGLILIGVRHFRDAHAGVSAATLYLLLPYSFLLLPFTPLHVGQWYQVWPASLIIGAFLAYRRPAIAGFLLGIAAGTVYFPLFLLPVWLSFYGRNGAGRCAGAFLLAVTLCGAGVGWLLWSDGAWPRSLHVAEALADWHPWREPRSGTFGLWSVVPGAWAYRLPVFIAYVAFVGATTFWPKPKNLGHLFALSAAVLLGVQFWYADQGGVHIFWYLPLVLLLVFRPNLSDRVAPTIQPESDWLRWLGRNAVRAAMWVLRLPDAPIQVG